MNIPSISIPPQLATTALVIAIGIAIMQMLKYADTNNVFKRFYPLVSFLIGMAVSYFLHFTLIASLTTSLAIAGFYDGWKFTVMGNA